MYKVVFLVANALLAATVSGAAVAKRDVLHVSDNHDMVKTTIVSQPAHIQIHEPTLAKVGDIVENIPTAVSHQSSTIVHSHAQRVTPIVAPAVRSYMAPAVHTTVVQQQQQPARAMLRALPLPLSYQPNAALLHALYNGYLQHHAFSYATPYYY